MPVKGGSGQSKLWLGVILAGLFRAAYRTSVSIVGTEGA
jgi:hypothetical protein